MNFLRGGAQNSSLPPGARYPRYATGLWFFWFWFILRRAHMVHGSRSGRSCETQFITTFQDIVEMYDQKGSQIDIAVLNFSKAFDTVPHGGLLSKLKHYGIDKNIWQWISNFFRNVNNVS